MPAPASPLDHAFDPDAFRAVGHRLIDLLADHLAQTATRTAGPVLPWVEPEQQMQRWALGTVTDADALFARFVAESMHLRDPRYVGHQVTPTLPLAALADFVTSFLNNGTAIYEMSPVGTPLERIVVRWMCDKLGYGADADGLLTSGGSLGNLTALLAARQARTGHDVWTEGQRGEATTVLVSDQAHYCIRRGVQVMGLGVNGVTTVPTDARFKMTADAVAKSLAKAARAGRRAIAVVASACSTAVGAFDPIDELADLCRREGLWLHVDAAHGAAAALSPRYRALVRGIEQADSIVFDAHKMLLMPSLLTGVLFRAGRHSHRAFDQEASYLFGATRNDADRNELGKRTLECTKPTNALKLYAALAVHGEAPFVEHVERTFDLGKAFAERITASGDFELAVAPECNIVCFRYRPAGVVGAALDALQRRVRQRVVESGAFYLVQATLPAGTFLRTTLIHPGTDASDLDGLLDAVRKAAT
jgi:L-2,4-diaminobutyrate decarboxylase